MLGDEEGFLNLAKARLLFENGSALQFEHRLEHNPGTPGREWIVRQLSPLLPALRATYLMRSGQPQALVADQRQW